MSDGLPTVTSEELNKIFDDALIRMDGGGGASHGDFISLSGPSGFGVSGGSYADGFQGGVLPGSGMLTQQQQSYGINPGTGQEFNQATFDRYKAWDPSTTADGVITPEEWGRYQLSFGANSDRWDSGWAADPNNYQKLQNALATGIQSLSGTQKQQVQAMYDQIYGAPTTLQPTYQQPQAPTGGLLTDSAVTGGSPTSPSYAMGYTQEDLLDSLQVLEDMGYGINMDLLDDNINDVMAQITAFLSGDYVPKWISGGGNIFIDNKGTEGDPKVILGDDLAIDKRGDGSTPDYGFVLDAETIAQIIPSTIDARTSIREAIETGLIDSSTVPPEFLEQIQSQYPGDATIGDVLNDFGLLEDDATPEVPQDPTTPEYPAEWEDKIQDLIARDNGINTIEEALARIDYVTTNHPDADTDGDGLVSNQEWAEYRDLAGDSDLEQGGPLWDAPQPITPTGEWQWDSEMQDYEWVEGVNDPLPNLSGTGEYQWNTDSETWEWVDNGGLIEIGDLSLPENEDILKQLQNILGGVTDSLGDLPDAVVDIIRGAIPSVDDLLDPTPPGSIIGIQVTGKKGSDHFLKDLILAIPGLPGDPAKIRLTNDNGDWLPIFDDPSGGPTILGNIKDVVTKPFNDVKDAVLGAAEEIAEAWGEGGAINILGSIIGAPWEILTGLLGPEDASNWLKDFIIGQIQDGFLPDYGDKSEQPDGGETEGGETEGGETEGGETEGGEAGGGDSDNDIQIGGDNDDEEKKNDDEEEKGESDYDDEEKEKSDYDDEEKEKDDEEKEKDDEEKKDDGEEKKDDPPRIKPEEPPPGTVIPPRVKPEEPPPIEVVDPDPKKDPDPDPNIDPDPKKDPDPKGDPIVDEVRDPVIPCFVAGTKIDMADGTQKNIEDISVGDKVQAIGGKIDAVSYVHDIPVQDHVLWTLNGRITATEAHPFLTTEGWKSANPEASAPIYEGYGIAIGQLEVGDILVGSSGNVELSSLESKEGRVKVYNFTTESTHTYMVDGVVSHNKSIPWTPPKGEPPKVLPEEPPPLVIVEPPITEPDPDPDPEVEDGGGGGGGGSAGGRNSGMFTGGIGVDYSPLQSVIYKVGDPMADLERMISKSLFKDMM